MTKHVSKILIALILAVALLGCATTAQKQHDIKMQDAITPKLLKNTEALVNVEYVLYDYEGSIKGQWAYQNIVTNVGKNAAIKQIFGDSGGGAQPAKFNYVEIGTGTNSENAADTSLQTPCGTRVQDTNPSFPSTGQGRIVATFAAGNCTGAVTESGIFNASSSGTLLARKVFSAINKGASDSLQITWTITLN